MNTKKLNRPTITTEDIEPILLKHQRIMMKKLEVEGHRRGLQFPVIWSPPGAAKSAETLRVVTEVMERQEFDVRGGSMNTTDIRVPGVDMEKGIAKYCGNDEMPFIGNPGIKEDGAYAVIWDELGDMNKLVGRMFKEATEANRIGNKYYPINTLHIGLGNGMEHGCMSEKSPASNINRRAEYHLRPDADGFERWLQEKSYNPELEAIVNNNKNMFWMMGGDQFDFKAWNGVDQFASFRSTTELAFYFETELVVYGDAGERSFDIKRDPLIRQHLYANAGPIAAEAIWAFLEILDAIDLTGAYADPDNYLLPTDPTKQWVIATKLASETCDSNMDAAMTLASRLLGPGSYLELFVYSSIQKFRPEMAAHPKIVQWLDDNAEILCDTIRA